MHTLEATDQISDIIDRLDDYKRTSCQLPGDGYLLLEHDLPFLVIYSKSGDEDHMEQLVKTKASYLFINPDYLAFYQELACNLSSHLSAKYGSFLILDLESGPVGGNKFVISGNTSKFMVTLQVLYKELSRIEKRRGETRLEVEIHDTNDLEGGLLDVEGMESCGAQYLKIQIPRVYLSAGGVFYPVYFRRFKKSLNKAIRKALYEYSRVQTSVQISSYAALGTRKLTKTALNIDEKLCEIQKQYQFLILVAPSNIQEIREQFFASKCRDNPFFYYRLLPVDPDILKRQLYRLRLETIEDPALALLFDEKREELDQELTMLKERGTENFLYRGARLYGVVGDSLLREAKEILNEIPEKMHVEKGTISPMEFKAMAEAEFSYFREQSPGFSSQVHVREDINVIMVSYGELYLPADYHMTEVEATSLIQHEIGTHVLTYYNGSCQPLQQLSTGLADYDALQEGIAVMSEYLAGALTGNRLRTLAGRVVAGDALLRGMDFKDMFALLHDTYGFTSYRAFNITSRMFQGGGFLKDIIYLKGLVELKDYIEAGGDLRLLMIGKLGIKHLDIMAELTARSILKPAEILPRYMEYPEYEQRIQEIRKGIPIHQMRQL